MALLPPKGPGRKAPRTDYYPSVMSAVQRLTNPGSAEERLKFYVRLRSASQLQFSNEAPDAAAASQSMEDLEAAINKVELELAKTRSTPPPVAPPAPPLAVGITKDEPPEPPARAEPARRPPAAILAVPEPDGPDPEPRAALPSRPVAPQRPLPPQRPAMPLRPSGLARPTPPPRPEPQRRPEPMGTPTGVEPTLEPDPAGFSLPPPPRPKLPAPIERLAPRLIPRTRPQPEEDYDDDVADLNGTSLQNEIPKPAYLAIATVLLVIAAIGSGAAVWFLAAPEGARTAGAAPATQATAAAPAATISAATIAATPVRNLRRVSAEALIGLRLAMPAALRSQPWAYELNGQAGNLTPVTLSGKPGAIGWVCKPDACTSNLLTFAVTLDGTNVGLGILSPDVNGGKPAFVGTQGSDAVKAATAFLTQATTPPA